MPNIKSAMKRVEITKKRTLRNSAIKSSVKTAIRKFENALENANIDEAKAKLTVAISALDKAVTKGVLHKNSAARKKSRLVKKLQKVQG
ncbi:30S ribosomal protein S20 [Thermincola ferriacetica]|uniref:Small ribosomal subunit protein bS20 n=2 Tax=Thermincola TaxID=278993 RepID=D5XAU6_THEPJ|nr:MULTISPECIES: 30S ribosomal protein S20 [Thermincola]ADG83300.1 ribosomal protein S20 [Thermincola potens JR]KNZ68834.1 30S ribosomal protein S20 [Thermincola ferriacetica]